MLKLKLLLYTAVRKSKPLLQNGMFTLITEVLCIVIGKMPFTVK